jgi:phosphoglycerate dehydrogenase-like enzyme
MTLGKLVFICRNIEPESRDVFFEEAPVGCQVVIANPNEGAQKTALQITDADYLVTYRSGHIPFKLIDAAKHLKLIQTMGQGTDHLPLRQARERGIYVCNMGGANTLSVAELTILLILATLRRLQPLSDSLKQGKFQGSTEITSVHEIYDKTVGIIGFGNIGRRVASLLYGFGANIIFHEKLEVPYAVKADFKARQVGLDELLSTSDIVTLHIPSLKSTKGMIDWKKLSMMKQTAYLINTSRADLVNQADLLRALNEKKIAGAGLDVWEPEPPDPENPLLHMDTVVATPHIGSLAWENWRPRVQITWGNVLRVAEGKEPLYQVYE